MQGAPTNTSTDNILEVVRKEVETVSIFDIHTHLFMPALGSLASTGIDDVLTYHYLEAEFFRVSKQTPESYWALSKAERADAIWQHLFVERAPLSEAARSVITILRAFDLPTDSSGLREARTFFAARDPIRHVQDVLSKAGVSEVVMTNDPLDPQEAPLWLQEPDRDQRFHSALRLDRLLSSWPEQWQTLRSQGYDVTKDADGPSISELRRFFHDWHARMRPVYMAVSLPDSFVFPEDSIRARLLSEAVLPSCEEFKIPLALMIGVRRQVNPALQLAGDGVGRANLQCLEHLCKDFPRNRFLVTVLSRENQHELCVYARKFSNLMPFGCWWFVNQPSIVEEITKERLELLGTSFIPQHSDARVLEHLISKWRETRRVLAPILAQSYTRVIEEGRPISRSEIRSDVARLFRSNFEDFCKLKNPADVV
jgi:hypothetical protein